MELTPFGLVVLTWVLPVVIVALMLFAYWRGYTTPWNLFSFKENWRHEEPFEFWSDMAVIGTMLLLALWLAITTTRDYLAGQL